MNVVVMGAGAIGSALGAILADAEPNVWFVARGPHLAALKESGLKVVGARDLLIHPVQAVATPSDIASADVILLTVKMWSVEDACRALRPLMGEETAIITLQNGIDAPDMAADILGPRHVMGGVAEISAIVEDSGTVRVNSKFGGIIFGERDGRKSDRALAFENICKKAGLSAEVTADIEQALWKKFMLLVALSGLTSVTRSSFGEIRSDPESRRLIEACVCEVIAVATAKGVDVEADALEQTMAMVDGAPPHGRTSMASDIAMGRRLELPWLGGRVVDLGRELGVPTPVNAFINTVLKFHQDGSRSK